MDGIFWFSCMLTLIAIIAKLSGYIAAVSWILILGFLPALIIVFLLSAFILGVIGACL